MLTGSVSVRLLAAADDRPSADSPPATAGFLVPGHDFFYVEEPVFGSLVA